MTFHCQQISRKLKSLLFQSLLFPHYLTCLFYCISYVFFFFFFFFWRLFKSFSIARSSPSRTNNIAGTIGSHVLARLSKMKTKIDMQNKEKVQSKLDMSVLVFHIMVWRNTTEENRSFITRLMPYSWSSYNIHVHSIIHDRGRK